VDGFGISTAFRLSDYDIEVMAAPGTGSGKIYRLLFRLTLVVQPFNVKAAYESNLCTA
jgi:hypothetical protein